LATSAAGLGRVRTRERLNFVSYSPVFPEAMRMFIERIPRDDAHIAELEAEVREFLAELDQKLAALANYFGGAKIAA